MIKTREGSLDALVRALKSQCNRHVNGSCHNLSCMERGGYKRGDRVDYGAATCERHEQAVALETLLANAGGGG